MLTYQNFIDFIEVGPLIPEMVSKIFAIYSTGYNFPFALPKDAQHEGWL